MDRYRSASWPRWISMSRMSDRPDRSVTLRSHPRRSHPRRSHRRRSHHRRSHRPPKSPPPKSPPPLQPAALYATFVDDRRVAVSPATEASGEHSTEQQAAQQPAAADASVTHPGRRSRPDSRHTRVGGRCRWSPPAHRGRPSAAGAPAAAGLCALRRSPGLGPSSSEPRRPPVGPAP